MNEVINMSFTSIPEIAFDALARAGFPRDSIGIGKLPEKPQTPWSIVVSLMKTIPDIDQQGSDSAQTILAVACQSKEWSVAAKKLSEAYLAIYNYFKKNRQLSNELSFIQTVIPDGEMTQSDSVFPDGTNRTDFELVRLMTVWHT